jgi:hypothetical protein
MVELAAGGLELATRWRSLGQLPIDADLATPVHRRPARALWQGTTAR